MGTQETADRMYREAHEKIGTAEGFVYVPIDKLEKMIISESYHVFGYFETVCCIRIRLPDINEYSVIGRYIPVHKHHFNEVYRRICARKDAIDQLIVLEQYRRMMS